MDQSDVMVAQPQLVMTWKAFKPENLPANVHGEEVERTVGLCGGEDARTITITMHRFYLQKEGSSALWLILGGPGDNGIQLHRKIIPRLLRMMPRVTIYVPRQRGTHYSSPLPMADNLMETMRESRRLLKNVTIQCYGQEHAERDLREWFEAYKHAQNIVYGISYGSHLAFNALNGMNVRFIMDSPFTSHSSKAFDNLLADCRNHWACQHLIKPVQFNSFTREFANMAMRLEQARVILDTGQAITLDLRVVLLRLMMMSTDDPDYERFMATARFLLQVGTQVDGGVAMRSMGILTDTFHFCMNAQGLLSRCTNKCSNFQMVGGGSYNYTLFAYLFLRFLTNKDAALRQAYEQHFNWTQPSPVKTHIPANVTVLTGDLDAHAPNGRGIKIRRMGHAALDHLDDPAVVDMLTKVLQGENPTEPVSLSPLNWLLIGVPSLLIPPWKCLPDTPLSVRLRIQAVQYHYQYPLWWLCLLIVIVSTCLVFLCLRWYNRRKEDAFTVEDL